MAKSMTTRQLVRCNFAPLKADESPGEIDATSVTQAVVGAMGVVEIVDFMAEPGLISFALKPLAASDQSAKAVITADADLGEGVTTITGETSEWTVTVAAEDMATHFAVNEADPEPA